MAAAFLAAMAMHPGTISAPFHGTCSEGWRAPGAVRWLRPIWSGYHVRVLVSKVKVMSDGICDVL